MNRVTNKTLDFLAEALNKRTGHPVEAYSRQEDGTYKANVGTYYIDGAYGGYALYQIVSEGGGIRDVFNRGHMKARELYDMMRAYELGLEDSK